MVVQTIDYYGLTAAAVPIGLGVGSATTGGAAAGIGVSGALGAGGIALLTGVLIGDAIVEHSGVDEWLAEQITRAIEQYRKKRRCPPSRLRNLQRQVGDACKTNKTSCLRVCDCQTLKKRFQRNKACLAARNQVHVECFPLRPEDDTHNAQTRDVFNKLVECVNRARSLNCDVDSW